MKVIELAQGSAGWLDWRKGKRMASESSAAMGKSPYTSKRKLAAIKKGVTTQAVNAAMRRGAEREQDARAWFNAEMGIIGNPIVLESGDYGASLDWHARDHAAVMLAEFKVPLSLTSPLWLAAKSGTIPMMYQIQMAHQFAVSGAEYGFFVVYMPELRHGLIQRVEPNPRLWNEITSGWNAFWSEYMIDKGQTIETIKAYATEVNLTSESALGIQHHIPQQY